MLRCYKSSRPGQGCQQKLSITLSNVALWHEMPESQFEEGRGAPEDFILQPTIQSPHLPSLGLPQDYWITFAKVSRDQFLHR